MFTWIPLYKELAAKILDYRERQGDLIQIVREMESKDLPVISTADKKEGKTLPLDEIDPFTFFACFNRRQTDENRKTILSFIKEKFGLASQVPSDFAGVPVINPQKSWFFPFVATRKKDDIPSLWQLAGQAVHGRPQELDKQLFNRCLLITSVGEAKLTMGLFWLNPDQYIACDKVNRALFKSRGIDVDVNGWAEYLTLVTKVKATLGSDFPKISHNAYELSEREGTLESSWAGGFQWGDISKLDEFITGNKWQIGWAKDDPKPAAKKTWDRFSQIRVGDRFAIKGYGGRNDVRIHYVGRVIGKSEDGVLQLKSLEGPLYRGKAPPGPSWFDTLVPLEPKSVADAIFLGVGLVQPEGTSNGSKPPDVAQNVILYGSPGTGKTFATIRRAVELVDNDIVGDHLSIKNRFDELVRRREVQALGTGTFEVLEISGYVRVC